MVPPPHQSIQGVLGAARESFTTEIREATCQPKPEQAADEAQVPASRPVASAGPQSAEPEPSSRMSVPVPGSRGSLPPGVALPMQGSFIVPRNAADLLKLPLRRSLAEQDLDPIWLPVLLISLARRKDIVGTLELKSEGSTISVQLVSGGVVQEAFKPKDPLLAATSWKNGTYQVQPASCKPPADKPDSLSKIAVELVRSVLRQDTEASIEAAFGDKLKQAPKVGPRGMGLADAVGFWTAEKRFLKYQCDGSMTGLDAMKSSGVSRFTALQVVFVLDLFGEISWGAPHRKTGPTVAEQVASRSKEASHANHFELLGIHWSVLEEEVEQAFRKFQADYGPGTDAAREAPEAARLLMKAATQARDTLVNRASRMAYLKQIKPDLDYLALSELLRTRSEALNLKGQELEARVTDRLRSGVDPLARAAAARVVDVSKVKKD